MYMYIYIYICVCVCVCVYMCVGVCVSVCIYKYRVTPVYNVNTLQYIHSVAPCVFFISGIDSNSDSRIITLVEEEVFAPEPPTPEAGAATTTIIKRSQSSGAPNMSDLHQVIYIYIYVCINMHRCRCTDIFIEIYIWIYNSNSPPAPSRF